MAKSVETEPSPEYQLQHLPRHLVIIPDGNGRWAQKHNLPILEGHLRGAKRMLALANRVEKLNIDVCTFWGFSSENWSRDKEEVDGILQITRNILEADGDEWIEKGRRFRHVGRKDRLPKPLLEIINKLEGRSASNSGQTFVLALDYGGRDEIVRAVGKVGTDSVNEDSFEDFLDTAGLPQPDLIVRTSEEYRTSGIYPYQGVYAEFVSSPVLFPDFEEKELDRCLAEFARRKRRFGARLDTDHREPFDWLNLSDTSFEGFVKQVLPHIEKTAAALLDDWRKNRFYKHPGLQEDVKVYENLLSGGKKIRASLVVLGYENAGGEPEYREGSLLAATGYEILHNAFLIHDDIEDNSPIRRGQPSVHEEYRLKHEASSRIMFDSIQYGRALALNTGSLGPLKVQDILWRITNKHSRILEAQKWVRHIVEMSVLGQRHDLTDVTLNDLTKREVYTICYQKTAVYTVVGPLTLGAILAGASHQDLGHINSFGVNLGIAFQLIDDHLGLYGSEEVLGKPIGSDLTEAKKTLHFFEAWNRANNNQRRFLQSVWGNQDVSQTQVDQVKQLIENLGVKDDVLKTAKHLSLKAKRIIPRIATSKAAASIFEELADFVVKRHL